jgi:hypothetical protein
MGRRRRPQPEEFGENPRWQGLGRDCHAGSGSNTKKQCRNRWWYDVLASSIGRSTGRTGKWREDEDIKLKSAIQAHGDKHWAAIAALVPGRTQKQCSDRWRRKYTDPNRSAVQGKTLGILNKAPALGRDPH